MTGLLSAGADGPPVVDRDDGHRERRPAIYDASCNNVQKITSGELRANGQFNNEQGDVRITWSGCGSDPQFKYVRGQ